MQGGDGDISLADRVVDGGGRLVGQCRFAGRFNAQPAQSGCLAKAEQVGVSGLHVRADVEHERAHLIEKRIAGGGQGLRYSDRAGRRRRARFQQTPVRAPRLGIAIVAAIPEIVAVKCLVSRPNAFGRRCQRRHNFVDRTRRVLFGQGLVGKWIANIGVETRDRPRHVVFGIRVEDLRVKTGVTRQGENLAAVDIHGDDRAAGGDPAPVDQGIIDGVGQRLRRDLLQAAVDGGGYRLGIFAGRPGHFADEGVAAFHDAQQTLRAPGQRRLIRAFDAGAANLVARCITQGLPTLQFIGGNGADKTDRVRRDAVAIIAARAILPHLAEWALARKDGAVLVQVRAISVVKHSVDLGDMETRLAQVIGEDGPKRVELPPRHRSQRRQAGVDAAHVLLYGVEAVYLAVLTCQGLAIAVENVGARREIRLRVQARPRRQAIDDIQSGPGDLPAAVLDHSHHSALVRD